MSIFKKLTLLAIPFVVIVGNDAMASAKPATTIQVPPRAMAAFNAIKERKSVTVVMTKDDAPHVLRLLKELSQTDPQRASSPTLQGYISHLEEATRPRNDATATIITDKSVQDFKNTNQKS